MAAVLSGCSADGAGRSETGEIESPGAVDVLDVRVGDCFMDPDDVSAEEATDVYDLAAVPCAEPHHNEVYAVFDMAEGRFPGEDEVDRLSVEGCAERFADFVGVPYSATRLDVTYLFPTRQSWSDGDRQVVCAVYDPVGLTEGSVEDAGADYELPTVGDCRDKEGLPVDCGAEHDAEIYFVTELEDGRFPGEGDLEVEAEQRCIDEFSDYVGVAYEDSALDFFYYLPTEETWADGDRRLECAVYDPSGALTGSVRGTGD